MVEPDPLTALLHKLRVLATQAWQRGELASRDDLL